MFKKLLVLAFILISHSVWAQNVQCPNRPASDNSNACANTRFVQAVINNQVFSITNYGAIADGGITDNGPFIRLAMDAAALVGGVVYIPPSTTWFGVSTCRNNAVFDMTGTNGNKSMSIYGGGWNEKPFAAPTGSWILPNSSFPATCSWLRYSGTDKVTGVTLHDFGIGEFGGSLGTPKGLHGIFIDASNPAFYLQNFLMDHVYIGNMAIGNSFKCTTGSAATPGCMPDSTIINSKFMSFNADFLADHVTLDKNTIGQNTTIDARNIGIEFAQCSGCTSTTISQNNISNFNSMVVIHGSNKTVIRDNEMEMSAGFTNIRGAMIDLVGDVATVEAYTITGNQLAQQSLVGDYAPVKAAASSGQIYDNRIGLAKATPYDYITITGAALGTFVGYNDCSFANATSTTRDLACAISSLGPFGFQYTPFGFSLPGSTSGRVTINTQAVAGSPNLLFGTSSGTVASSATSPLVINATTGVITCPTCATSSGGGAITGTSPIAVSAGGVVSFAPAGTSFGVLYNNAATLGNTAAGTNGQLFLGVTGGAPNWGTMSNDATITNAGVLTLASTISAAGPIGSATVAPIITFDAKGRLTTVTSATITPTASSITGGAALTKVDDTNVTLTLGGSPTTALLAATSITAGWTGTLANARLATMATNTVKGNATSGTASPTDLAVGTCSTAASALIWTTNTGFGCNTSITANSATSATNATNGATVATTTNASFFPLFAASSTNSNQPFNLDTTLTYNPSTDTLTATNFAGNATTATTATTGTNATNTAITDDTTTNATVYPTWVTAATGNLPQKVSSTKVTFNPSTGTFSVPVLSMAAGSGAFAAGTSATSGQLTSMLLNGGSTGGSYMAWQAGNVTYAYIGDDRSILGAANDNLLIQTQSGDGMHFQTNGANTDRFVISSAGVVSMPTLGSDTATVDNTVCVSGTGVILKGSGALGVCLGTSSARYKHDIVSMGAGLAEIVKLTPKNFFYNKGYGDDGYRLQYGFVAEDVVKVLPQLVGLDKEKKASSVDMLAMVPIMINAIKQLKAANENLEARLVKLEARK